MTWHSRTLTLVFPLLIAAPPCATADTMGQLGHFPTTVGSSWEYAVNALTTNDQGQQVHLPASETVNVTGVGLFHSEIGFSNGNTTTSDNYYQQNDALYVTGTRIVITATTNIYFPITTTTTSNNSYSPPQEAFPSELYAGNVETSSGAFTTSITTVTETPYGSPPPTTTTSSGTQTVQIAVAGSETVTVGAGTFSAVKLVKTITTTEGGTTVSYDSSEWYAEGVGLVRQRSQNMDRDLVSYNVKPVDATSLNVEISGVSRSFPSLQGALDVLADEDVLKTRVETMSGNFVYDRGVNATFSGGWNDGFSSNNGTYTRINGTLTIKSGGLVVENLIIG